MSPSLLKRDVWAIGLLIGIILPILFFIVLFIVDFEAYKLWDKHLIPQFDFMFLLSITANIFPIRHYLIKLRFEKTGMGILLVTIAEITLYFFMYYKP